jgi:hypothetical protein
MSSPGQGDPGCRMGQGFPTQDPGRAARSARHRGLPSG